MSRSNRARISDWPRRPASWASAGSSRNSTIAAASSSGLSVGTIMPVLPWSIEGVQPLDAGGDAGDAPGQSQGERPPGARHQRGLAIDIRARPRTGRRLTGKSATLTRSAIPSDLGVAAKVDRVLPLGGDQELGVPTRLQDQPRRLEETWRSPKLVTGGPTVPITGTFQRPTPGRAGEERDARRDHADPVGGKAAAPATSSSASSGLVATSPRNQRRLIRTPRSMTAKSSTVWT